MSRLDEIEERLRAATPGPWIPSKYGYQVLTDDEERTICELRSYKYADEVEQVATASLIAHAPADLAALLRVARAAQNLDTFMDFGAPLGIDLEVGDPAPIDEAARELYAALAALSGEGEQ